MARYHIINPQTKIVEDADRKETLTLAEVQAKFPGKEVVLSEMGKPNKPVIMPGFLWLNSEFWAPQRAPKAVTSGQPSSLSRAEFLQMFDFAELTEIFNYEFDTASDTKTEKQSNKIKRRVRAAVHLMLALPQISIPSETATEVVDSLLDAGLITKDRKNEILSLKTKRV